MASNYPKFLVVHREKENDINVSFSTVNPFFIHKSLIVAVGEVQDMKKLPSGDLLIESSSITQSNSLMKLHNLLQYNVTVTPHITLNSSRDAISHPEFLYVPDDEILENLKDQLFTEVQ